MPWSMRCLPTLMLVFAVTACGGGGADPEAPASRLEVGPQSALLIGAGASRSLDAHLFDAAGTPVSGAVVWSSSDPRVVSVDASGTVRAVAAVGSARITATSGALQSSPALVTVAQPTAGARLLADSEIVAGPTPVDAAAEPAAANAYDVVLRGVPALAVGTLVIASEAANVAGRVLAVQPEGADQRVRLVSVPPKQLFTAFDFRDSVDLTQGPFEIPADLAAGYDVVQTGSTFVFTPKPVAPSGKSSARLNAAMGTRALTPFENCEATTGFGAGLPLPFALSAQPAFQVTLNGTVQRTADANGTRIVVTGSPVFKFATVLEITSAFEAKIVCKLTAVKRRFRVPGWAGLFFGGDVEFGVGFEVGGKVTLASAKLGGTAELKPTVLATLDCPVNASCGLTGNVTTVSELTPEFTTPSLEQLRFEPAINLFGFVDLEAGNADVEQLQFKAIEVRAGVNLAASLTPEFLQIANADPALGRSQYALAFKGEVGPGIKLGEFLAFAGLGEIVPLKLEFGLPLGTSPAAESVTADQARYLPGERATVTVKLALPAVRFPSGLIYNVKTVQLRRSTGLLSTELLAEQVATNGQTDFVLAFDSPGLLDAADIVAFVDTRVLPFLPVLLEMGSASSSSLPVSISTTTLPDATQGSAYTTTLAAIGTAPFTWAATGLPAGLALNAQSGQITGTPTVATSATVATAVTDANGRTANRTFTLTVTVAQVGANGLYTGLVSSSGCSSGISPPPAAATVDLRFLAEPVGTRAFFTSTGGLSIDPVSFTGPAASGLTAFTLTGSFAGPIFPARTQVAALGTVSGVTATLIWQEPPPPRYHGCLRSFSGTRP